VASSDCANGDRLFRLDGRRAFVSGAAGHLGSAMARALGEAGAEVLINGRDRARLEALQGELRDRGVDVEVACFDIMDTKHVRAFFGSLDRIDVLVNNAYTGRAASMDKASPEDFEIAFKSSVTAAFEIVRAAEPALTEAARAEGQASVINISSMYGSIAPDPSIYGASGLDSPPFYGPAKAGILQLTRYLATHLAQKKIRVNAITPGPFPSRAIQEEKPEFIARLCDKVPMKRIGQADEIRGAVLFLASDASSYMTGATLPIDGGWTAW
jgi:NAD(P)-dependent dehydrogenase (short-subunit alcohol dehydrogenase family)